MILRWGAQIVLIAMAVASGWVLHRIDPADLVPAEASRHVPDFYMENFTTTTMDENGRPKRRMEAAYMAHFPDTNTNEFSKPYLVIYRGAEVPWHVTSERGWLSASGDVMLLLGKVDIWRNTKGGGRNMHIRTEDLRVLPESQYGETDKLVVITTPHSQSNGVGMRAYLDESRLELLSRVHTVYARNAFSP